MMNSIQSYVHGPHSIASNEETFVCSNSEAFTSELIEHPEYISVICLACSTYQPHDIVLTGAKGLRPGIKYFSQSSLRYDQTTTTTRESSQLLHIRMQYENSSELKLNEP